MLDTSSHKRSGVIGFLYSVSRNGTPEYWPLYVGANTIGQSYENDIVLMEGSVSKRHAIIRIANNSHCIRASIIDTMSTNGTFLNGEPLDFEPLDCKNSDIITIGNYKLLLILIDCCKLGLTTSGDFIDVLTESEGLESDNPYPDVTQDGSPFSKTVRASVRQTGTSLSSSRHEYGSSNMFRKPNTTTEGHPVSWSPCKWLKNHRVILGLNRSEYQPVFASAFAPAEVKRKSHMLVQVYLHLFEETEKVKTLAQESDKDAERRDYIPLDCALKKGDKVNVLLNIYGETLLMSEKKSVVWQGSFTKCSFDYFVPKDLDVDELSCVGLLTVNEVPVGEMRFITKIVEAPRRLNPEIIAHQYNKVFISYSHQDESKVKFLHKGLEMGGVEHFFDRDYLKAGDVFPHVIQDYINSADLFILCWSENASKSEYVQKERLQALERAFPQVKPEQEAKLRIYPMSIEPRAELPSDMKENYHFGEL